MPSCPLASSARDSPEKLLAKRVSALMSTTPTLLRRLALRRKRAEQSCSSSTTGLLRT